MSDSDIFIEAMSELEVSFQKMGRDFTRLFIIFTALGIGVVSGALIKAEVLSLSDLIQAYSAIALAYFAFVQVATREPVVFAWAEDWRDLIIENASDYPIYDIYYQIVDSTKTFGQSSAKIKIIYSQRSEKVEVHDKFQGIPSIVNVSLKFRTRDMEGPIYRRNFEVLLREPGTFY